MTMRSKECGDEKCNELFVVSGTITLLTFAHEFVDVSLNKLFKSSLAVQTKFDHRCEMRAWYSSFQQPPFACASAPRLPCQKHV